MNMDLSYFVNPVPVRGFSGLVFGFANVMYESCHIIGLNCDSIIRSDQYCNLLRSPYCPTFNNIAMSQFKKYIFS